MYDFIKKTARNYGFEEVFFVKPQKINGWRECADFSGLEHVSLFDDVCVAYPRAKSIILMLYPYAPFENDTHLSAYYIASNKAYHASKEVEKAILGAGFYAETARIPLRAAFLQNNIGVLSKNGLLRYSNYGSRIILAAIAADAAEPKALSIKETKPCEEDCNLCKTACPVGAIDKGLTQKKCMRYYMDNIPYPDFVLENIRHYMGCEICLYACKENAHLEKRVPTKEECEAFNINTLASGEDKSARLLVGKNFTKQKKLQYEALNFIEREENTKDK